MYSEKIIKYYISEFSKDLDKNKRYFSNRFIIDDISKEKLFTYNKIIITKHNNKYYEDTTFGAMLGNMYYKFNFKEYTIITIWIESSKMILLYYKTTCPY